MIIYSVQVTILQTREAAWLEFMQQKHLNEVLDTGCFNGHQLLKQADWDSETDARYVINYSCPSRQILDEYFELHAPRLREDVAHHFGGEFSAERKIYEVL
jgi:hypothetical protein